ncbi:hypothetical protein [Flagellimonas flava]|uniref:hypothetical protein n=1 Tax=Flagellimonas flava TaxID=570519 RepID=UPI003D65A15E
MKRVIVDYKKLNESLLNLLVEKYPDGYGDRDIISFRNSNGDWVECIEVQTEDTTYLVKVSQRLTMAMEDFEMDTTNEDALGVDESNAFEEE